MANFQYSSFDPTLTNPATGLPGAMIFPGPGAGRIGKTRHYDTDFSNFGPRAGFSWRVGDDTVVRGGVGVYYQTLGNGGCGCTLGFAGIPAQVNSDGLNPAIQWDNGIPVLLAISPVRRSSTRRSATARTWSTWGRTSARRRATPTGASPCSTRSRSS